MIAEPPFEEPLLQVRPIVVAEVIARLSASDTGASGTN
jgi:hypothetical protein